MAVLAVGGGLVSIDACAGRGGDFAGDLAALLAWGPDLVVSLATSAEMAGAGAGGLAVALADAGVAWRHCPAVDYGVPGPDWDAVSEGAGQVLARGGRVHLHCMAGCGRSGAAALRLMVDAGEQPDAALIRLRQARPCAVETPVQFSWAAAGR